VSVKNKFGKSQKSKPEEKIVCVKHGQFASDLSVIYKLPIPKTINEF
jgi:hypothetical protein